MSAAPAPAAPLVRAADLHRAGRHDEAERLARQALARDPSDAVAHALIADILMALRRQDQALFHAERAADLERGGATFRIRLGVMLSDVGRVDDAERAFRRAMAASPGDPRPHHNLGKLALDAGDAALALGHLREAVRLAPRELGPLSLMANAAGSVLEDGRELLRVHREYADALEAAARPLAPPPPGANPRDPDRPVRVGLLSPDFRAHSVASFIEAILGRVDQSRLPFTCYFISFAPDAVTPKLRSLASAWRDAQTLTDEQIAALIRRDAIDVLIDLAGLTTGGRPGVIAMRPAPVQVMYCGYMSTTGMRSFSWRIVDALTDPPGYEAHSTERLARVPGCHLCWTPPSGAPDPGPAPCVASGSVTFGSFNALHKLSDPCLALWAGALDAVPGSRLLLKAGALAHEATRRRLLDRLRASGIDPARVELLGPTRTQHDHLSLYQRVDVALDTVPFNGATTTCEALWMGVPVVTCAGARHGSRVGLSLVTGAGVPELAAASPEEFVARVRALAEAPRALSDLRLSLRDRVARSALCAAPAFARAFEGVVREIWREWCRAGETGGTP